MGRVWDESFYVGLGRSFVDLTKKGDFKNQNWYRGEASNGPPLALYVYGLASDLDINHFSPFGKPVFNYNFTYSRLVSALFFSFTVVLITIFGWNYISKFAGITAGIILSMLPFSLGLSQLATLESFVIFFFTATIFSFINLLIKFSLRKVVLTGVLLGMALMVKYTNFLLIPLTFLIFIAWVWRDVKRIKMLKKYSLSILGILVIAFLTILVIWPMPWFHLSEVISHNLALRNFPHSVPEVFFGRLMLVPEIYYFVYFLITTPMLVLAFFLIGLKTASRKKEWIFSSVLVWFVFPFVQSFYNFRQHGVRYIIEIYAPLALISAIGIEFIISKITKVWLKAIFLTGAIGYSFLILYRITPYYLDYFNEVVGGAKNVYENRLFQLGWWGQGIREAAYYLEKNAKPGSKIGIALSPSHVMPSLRYMKVEKYNAAEKYNYVVVNFYNVLREGFDDRQIRKIYKTVYEVNADGAKLVSVYKLR